MDDLALIRDAALEAGHLALKLQREGLKVWRKAGGSPVTNGDLALDKLLKARLTAARPDYGWLSEETADDAARLSTGRQFLVDPIDGTTAYIRDRPWFAVSIAVAEAGEPVAAAIFAPATDELFEAARGAGARRNGEPISPSPTERLEACRMTGDPAQFSSSRWPEPWPDFAVERRNAIAYRMALVGTGEFDAAVSLGWKHEWDLAAGDLIAREAGARSTDPHGRRLRFNTPDARVPGLICAAPKLFPLILERTAPIDLPA